ncbi:hypothetical protein QOV41_18430 [Devosia sp. RR2S18]|nr:hypothetical protein [Devosia sp. RR2S18]WIJ24961.1 hypothetical protein QOV41_18430 [Devosia sp. RR2S18]
MTGSLDPSGHIRTTGAMPELGNMPKVCAGQIITQVLPENALQRLLVGLLNMDDPRKSAGTDQSRIKLLGVVGCAHDDQLRTHRRRRTVELEQDVPNDWHPPISTVHEASPRWNAVDPHQ